MRKVLAIFPALLVALTLATQAAASTSVNFSATLHEPLGGPVNSPFSCPSNEGCGSGEVVDLGQVSEKIVFNACGFRCDLRTLTFADGSRLVNQERPSDFDVPGQSYREPSTSFGNPFTVTITDTVDGALSTGMFAGASGTLTGNVSVAGAMAIITLSGPITLA
jgi:hypothetical protein